MRTSRPSTAQDPPTGGSGTQGDVAAVRQTVFRGGAAVDRAGTAAAGVAVADLVFGAQRAPCNGIKLNPT